MSQSLKDKLSPYKVNVGYTEGVIIQLDMVPGVDFRVILPGPYNRAYMAAVYGGDLKVKVVEKVDEDTGKKSYVSEFEEDPLVVKDVQTDAFMQHCLVTVDGEPPFPEFAKEYPEAVDELFAKAQEIVEDVTKVVEESSKKPEPTSTGSSIGMVG